MNSVSQGTGVYWDGDWGMLYHSAILSVYPWIGNTQSDSSPNKRMRDSDITRFSTIYSFL